jgi:hypothetical protein
MDDVTLDEEGLSSEPGMMAYVATYGGIRFDCLIRVDAVMSLAAGAEQSVMERFDRNRRVIAEATRRRLVADPGFQPILTESDVVIVGDV